MLDTALTELSAYSWIELVAVLTSLGYILLAARDNRYCWVAAFISSLLFIMVMWRARLLMDAGLNFYYALMAIYGWVVWTAKLNDDSDTPAIETRPAGFHLAVLVAVLVLTLFSGSALATYSDAAFPFLDSITTWGALIATWMLAKKILETWLYWLALDSLSIYLYYHKDLHFTLMLFIVYVGMSLYAWFHWRGLLQQQRIKR